MVKLTNVTSLTGNGLRDWLIQRVTSIVMVVYIIFLLGFLIANPGLQFFTWQALFKSSAFRIFSVLFLLSLMWHAWIGMWTITTDYLKPLCIRLPVQIIIILALMTYVIWGVSILWSI